jgi:hypothetical protein
VVSKTAWELQGGFRVELVVVNVAVMRWSFVICNYLLFSPVIGDLQYN